MMRRALLLVMCVGIIAALGLGTVSAQAPAPQRGGTIRVGVTQEFLNLDPHVATAFSSTQIFDLVYETLLRYNPKTLEIEPNLAQSWSVSENGLDYTLTLRRNAVFH
ncbi:MAG: ABC transporter substrate-binding protein, partial [Anaerolineales bacterium]